MSTSGLILKPAPDGRNLPAALKSGAPRPVPGPAVPPPTFGRVLLMMVWKNFTIRKRRKLEQLLMLFQIFIWFGWGAARFLLAGQSNWLPSVSPQSNAPFNFYRHPTFAANHPIALTVTSDPGYQVFEDRDLAPRMSIAKYFEGHPTVDGELLNDVMGYFQESWVRTLGKQPIRMFKNNGTMSERMRLDERIAFGIEVERLLPDDNNVSFALNFKDDEVPIPIKTHGHLSVCRQSGMKYEPDKVVALQRQSPRQCDAGKYLQSPFVLAESVLANAVIRAKAARQGVKNPIFAPLGKQRQPLINRIELPGVSIVGEDYPLHIALHTTYSDLAGGTPIFILFAFSRFIISSIQDVVAEKESK